MLQLSSSQPEAAKLPTDFQKEDLRLSESLRSACRCHSQHVPGTMERNSEQSVRFIHTHAVRYALSASLAMISSGLTQDIKANHHIGDHMIYRLLRCRYVARPLRMDASAVPDGVRSRRRPSQACYKTIKYLTRSIIGTWMDVLI